MVLSFRGGSLLLLLLVDTICLPRPGALASASPASTPLSSLRVCPLSESWESVEAAGNGEQEERGGLYPGVREGFLEEAMEWTAGGIPQQRQRNEGNVWLESRETSHHPSTY